MLPKKVFALLAAAIVSACGMPALAQGPANQTLPPANAPASAPAPSGPVTGIGIFDGQPDGGRNGYFTAGAGLYFLTPFATSNPAFNTTKTVAPNTTINHQQDFGETMNAAPLVWLGYTFDNGWGLRARWFDISYDAHAAFAGDGTTIVSPPGSGLSSSLLPVPVGSSVVASQATHLYALDFEATNNWVINRWSILTAAGVRYAHISQTYSMTMPPATTVALDGNTAWGGNSFNGAGPTLAIELRRQISDSDFFFYGSARGSLLFGSSHVNAVVPAEIPDPVVTSQNSTIVVPVGELEIGAEWAHTFGRTRLFAQLAFVGQCWWGVGNAVQSMPLNFDDITTPGSNLGFIGGVARVGLSF